MSDARQTAIVARRGVLPATAVGAALGVIAGILVDRGSVNPDPTFAGGIGAAVGAILGRSAWIRVGVARIYGIQPAAMVAILLGRVLGCVLLGVGIIATLSSERAPTDASLSRRLSYLVAGAVLLVVTAVIEQRWLRRRTVDHATAGAQADASLK